MNSRLNTIIAVPIRLTILPVMAAKKCLIIVWPQMDSRSLRHDPGPRCPGPGRSRKNTGDDPGTLDVETPAKQRPEDEHGKIDAERQCQESKDMSSSQLLIGRRIDQ